MTLTSFFNGLSTNLIAGGVGSVLLLAALFWKANKVAATGSKAKMASWTMAPALMVIAAVLAHGVAAAVVIPKLQAMFTSAPMQNTASMGSAIVQTLDNWLFTKGGDGGQLAGAAAFRVPNSGESSAPANYVNGGTTASFASQPAPVQANTELQIVTDEQAVQAINAFDATPTPSAAEYIANVIEQSNELPGTYTVKGGDSLAKIAQQIYGDAKLARFLCRANGLADCNSIRAGMILAIPPANSAAPANNGGTTYMVSAQPAQQTQPAQPQAVYVKPVQRNLANGQVIITSNADAVNAINALAQPTAAPQPQPTPRPAYVLDELLKKPANNGGGQAYIDQFLADQKNPQVASAGN